MSVCIALKCLFISIVFVYFKINLYSVSKYIRSISLSTSIVSECLYITIIIYYIFIIVPAYYLVTSIFCNTKCIVFNKLHIMYKFSQRILSPCLVKYYTKTSLTVINSSQLVWLVITFVLCSWHFYNAIT